MSKKALMVGDNCIDIYKDINKYYLTGNVVDTGVNMAILGTKVSIITNIARDKYGDQMLAMFKKHGLITDKLRFLDGKTAYTLMKLIDGDRVHGDYFEGVLEGINFDSDLEYAKGFDLVFSAFWGNAESLLINLSKDKNNQLIAFDFADRSEDPKVDLLDGIVDIGFFSWDKSEESCKEFLKQRHEKGMKIGICTFGADGSMAYDGNDFYRQKAEKIVELNNTVGAGDSFIAGFLSAYLEKKTIGECLSSGSILAAKIIQQFAPILGEEVYVY